MNRRESGEKVASEGEFFQHPLLKWFNCVSGLHPRPILLWWKRMHQVIVSLAVVELFQPHTFVPVSSLLVRSGSCLVTISSWGWNGPEKSHPIGQYAWSHLHLLATSEFKKVVFVYIMMTAEQTFTFGRFLSSHFVLWYTLVRWIVDSP